MAGKSDIEWTEATWNPVSGCTMVSPGCTNCYAMRMAARLAAMGTSKYVGTTRQSGGRAVWTGKVKFDKASLDAPLHWRKPMRIFVNSMSDLFQEGVDEKWIQQVWHVMETAHWHSFQILTKRPERMLEVLSKKTFTVLPNVWLGVSVEDAERSERIKILREVPAAVRFISFEPLLGSVGQVDLDGVHWAIVGGESGPKARTMNCEWVEEIQAQCDQQDVAFFFKQWGGKNKKAAGRTFRGRTWDQYPENHVS